MSGNQGLEVCPHCESDEGYYEKLTIKGSTIYRYTFDGSEAENGDLHDGLSYKRRSKFAYCCNCDKRLFEL